MPDKKTAANASTIRSAAGETIKECRWTSARCWKETVFRQHRPRQDSCFPWDILCKAVRVYFKKRRKEVRKRKRRRKKKQISKGFLLQTFSKIHQSLLWQYLGDGFEVPRRYVEINEQNYQMWSLGITGKYAPYVLERHCWGSPVCNTELILDPFFPTNTELETVRRTVDCGARASSARVGKPERSPVEGAEGFPAHVSHAPQERRWQQIGIHRYVIGRRAHEAAKDVLHVLPLWVSG